MIPPAIDDVEEDGGLAWVRTAATSRLLELVRSLRDPAVGDDPGHAVRLLNAIGVLRDAGNLVAEARSFQVWDRELILAGAALQRDVTQAAALLIELWHQPDHHDARTSPRALGKAIVAEIARQRIAVECAQLIGILLAESSNAEHGEWAESLVGMLVKRFALGDGDADGARDGAGDADGPRPSGEGRPVQAGRHGRPERDIVLFYTSLKSAGHEEQANRLLDLTLRAETRADRLRNLARELEHFVPGHGVLPIWLGSAAGSDLDSVITVAAALLTEQGPLPEAVVAVVAGFWSGKTITTLCGTLHEDRAAVAILERVGEGPPTRAAEVVHEWRQTSASEAVVQGRLDAVIGAAKPDPAPLSQLKDIVRILGGWDGATLLRTRFLQRAAVSVRNRSGADLVELLWMIDDERARREAAFEAADRLAECAAPDVVIHYVGALHELGTVEARRVIDLVRDALTDRRPCDADAIAEIGTGLWRHQATREYGEQLLKQHLRNEHAIRGADVVTVLRGLRALPESVMSPRQRRRLLHDTVALWSAVHLADAWDALSADTDPQAPQDREALVTKW